MGKSVDQDDLIKWSAMNKKEIKKLIDVCAILNNNNLIRDASLYISYCDRYKERDRNRFFISYTLHEYGERFLKNTDLNSINSFFKKHSSKNYKRYIGIGEKFAEGGRCYNEEDMETSDVFENILGNYANYFIHNCKMALSLGFDWDVIREITGSEMNVDRFQKLEECFGKMGKEWQEGKARIEGYANKRYWKL